MKPIFYLSILLSSMLLTSCYRKFDLEEYRTTPKMVINSAFSPDTVVMASISRTWFHSESKPDVTIRNAKVELYIDGSSRRRCLGKNIPIGNLLVGSERIEVDG